MVSLDDIYIYVKDSLLQSIDVTFHGDVIKFLDSLKDSKNWRCQKLLISIGIDLRTYEKRFGKSTEEFNKYVIQLVEIVLESQQDPYRLKTNATPSPSVKFGVHLRKKIGKCLPIIVVEKSESYFRIIPFGAFIDWVIKENFDYNIDELPTDFDYSRKERYYHEFKSGLRFTELEIKNLGSGNGWVYVANRLDLQNELLNKEIVKLLDSIGYYVSNAIAGEKYICLAYPNTITEAFYQPCTLTGDWGKIDYIKVEETTGNDFFLPYKNNDCWGRTCSVSGTQPEVKERTHKEYEFKNEYKFQILDLGELPSDLVAVDSNKIIRLAFNRYEDAI